MSSAKMIFRNSVVLGLLQSVLALPAPQMSYAPNIGSPSSIGGLNPTETVVATATSGALKGDASLLGGIAAPFNPATGDSAIVSHYDLVNGQEAPAELGLYLDLSGVENPQPIRGTGGQTDPGPRTYAYDKLNPDLFAPPSTDAGATNQLMWPMGLSHNRHGIGKESGWARQQNIQNLPAATAMAGVDMRLGPHSYRELHWHIANEWAFILRGSARITAMNEEGQSTVDDLGAGDVWFFPSGIPHSIQSFDEGVEFLLVFDDGNFSEDGTFLASELFLRNPKSVLSKNFHAPVDAFKNIPTGQLWIFPGTPQPANISAQNITSSAGSLVGTESYSYHFSQQKPFVIPGGSIKILDPTTFPIAAKFSAALVTVQPGAMREIHWHTTSDEWNFFLSGSARMTVFQAPAASRTFDFTAGDVGYVPVAFSHYIENTGTEDVIFLEILQADHFSDISVAQWLALTPPQTVKDHLNLPDSVIASLPKEKEYIKLGNKNMTALAGNGSNYPV